MVPRALNLAVLLPTATHAGFHQSVYLFISFSALGHFEPTSHFLSHKQKQHIQALGKKASNKRLENNTFQEHAYDLTSICPAAIRSR